MAIQPITRGQAAMVEIQRPGGEVAARWCSCWPGPNLISWDGEQWQPLQLAWSALESHAAAGAGATITMAALPSLWRLLQAATSEQWAVALQILQFDAAEGETGPPADAQVVATYRGLVRGAGLTTAPPTITWRLGLPDAPPFPALIATSFSVGTTCQL
jgi:hypothetical protein